MDSTDAEMTEKKGERINEGSIYEISRTCLPRKAPIHLKHIRAVLVAEKTDTHVRVKFPSILVLRNYFGTDKTTQHPSLDEQFVMGQKLAERVLSRQIFCRGYIMERHLESFWLISADMATSPSSGETRTKVTQKRPIYWTVERYSAARLKILAIMREKEALPGNPILLSALRDEALKKIHIKKFGITDFMMLCCSKW